MQCWLGVAVPCCADTHRLLNTTPFMRVDVMLSTAPKPLRRAAYKASEGGTAFLGFSSVSCSSGRRSNAAAPAPSCKHSCTHSQTRSCKNHSCKRSSLPASMPATPTSPPGTEASVSVLLLPPRARCCCTARRQSLPRHCMPRLRARHRLRHMPGSLGLWVVDSEVAVVVRCVQWQAGSNQLVACTCACMRTNAITSSRPCC